MQPEQLSKKQKLLSKYADIPKKTKPKAAEYNFLMRDQQAINEIESSEESQQSVRRRRVDSSDDDGGRAVEKKKKKKKGDKVQRKIRKMIRKKLGISKDEDVDEFIENLQIQGIQTKEIADYISKNKEIKFENQKVKKQSQDKFSMFQNEESSDLQIPQQARTVYRNKDGTIRGYSEKMAKQKHKEQVEKKLAEWEKGMKKQSSDSDNNEDYLLAKHRAVWDDPMKKWQAFKTVKPLTCKYGGPANRFDIKPGHRWDGVVRGNGFENKYIQEHNMKKAEKNKEYEQYLKNL